MTDTTRDAFEAAYSGGNMGALAYAHFKAGWQAATEQGKRQEGKDAELLVIDVYHSIGNDPFICAVFGKTTVGVLSQIEQEFIDNPNEGPSFEKGEGTYKYETSFCEGQFDAHGRCELRGYWEHDEIGFTATPQGKL